MDLTLSRPLTLIQVLFGSLLLALSAYIVIPLPFTPVPIALHATMPIVLGILFGPITATLAVATYLLEGMMGLPVFMAGASGLPWLFGPTGGYLLGFLPAAFIAGYLRKNLFLAFTFGHLALYATGLPQLALYTGYSRVLAAGFFPFLAGDVLKSLAFSVILRRRRDSL